MKHKFTILVFLICALYIPINTWVSVARSEAHQRLQDKVDQMHHDWYTYELDVSEYCEIINDDDCWWVE